MRSAVGASNETLEWVELYREDLLSASIGRPSTCVPVAGILLVVGLGALDRVGLAARWAVELGGASTDGVTGLLSWLNRKSSGKVSEQPH